MRQVQEDIKDYSSFIFFHLFIVVIYYTMYYLLVTSV